MNKDQIFEELFKKLLPLLLEEVETSFVEEIKALYISDFIKRYEKIIEMRLLKSEDPKDIVTKIELIEKSYLQNMTSLTKKQIYTLDKNLTRIFELSIQFFDMAKEAYNNKKQIPQDDVDKFSKEIVSFLSEVREHNKVIAEKLISEGVIDLKYSMGQTNITSFRLANYIKDPQIKQAT